MKRWCSMAMSGLLALTTTAGAARADETEKRPWKATINAYLYVVPDQDNFLMLTAPVDIRWFHVEARYNYEALRSGSAFAGIHAGWGEELKLKVTPMIGGVFGSLDGLVPALRWTLSWWKLDLYSESEIVVDFDDARRQLLLRLVGAGLHAAGLAALRRRDPAHTGGDDRAGLPARPVRLGDDPIRHRLALRIQPRLDDADLGRRRQRDLLIFSGPVLTPGRRPSSPSQWSGSAW